MAPTYGNYRRTVRNWRRPWMYATSWEEAERLPSIVSDDRLEWGHTQVRCTVHGWAAAGSGDVCGQCADLALEEQMRDMLQEGRYTIKCYGDPVHFRLVVHLHPEDVALLKELGHDLREEWGASFLELWLERKETA